MSNLTDTTSHFSVTEKVQYALKTALFRTMQTAFGDSGASEKAAPPRIFPNNIMKVNLVDIGKGDIDEDGYYASRALGSGYAWNGDNNLANLEAAELIIAKYRIINPSDNKITTVRVEELAGDYAAKTQAQIDAMPTSGTNYPWKNWFFRGHYVGATDALKYAAANNTYDGLQLAWDKATAGNVASEDDIVAHLKYFLQVQTDYTSISDANSTDNITYIHDKMKGLLGLDQNFSTTISVNRGAGGSGSSLGTTGTSAGEYWFTQATSGTLAFYGVGNTGSAKVTTNNSLSNLSATQFPMISYVRYTGETGFGAGTGGGGGTVTLVSADPNVENMIDGTAQTMTTTSFEFDGDVNVLGNLTKSGEEVSGVFKGKVAANSMYISGDNTKPTSVTGTYNTTVGFEAGQGMTSGTQNVCVGYNAGNAITTGNANIAIGMQAQYTSPAVRNYCTAVGHQSLYNFNGEGNTAMGYVALQNCHGAYNVAVGYVAMQGLNANQGPDYSVGIGYLAGRYQGESDRNTWIGPESGPQASNTITSQTGSDNVAIGYQAMMDVTTGANCVTIGRQAGTNITTGEWNTFMGSEAGYTNTTGYKQTCIGFAAGYSLTTGYGNTCVGALAGNDITSSLNNTFIGNEAGAKVNTGSYNVGVGRNTFNAMTSGASNIAIGNYTAAALTTGNYNIFLGESAGNFCTNGTLNIAIGQGCAMFGGQNSQYMIALGGYAGPKSTDTGQLMKKLYIGAAANDNANKGVDSFIYGDYNSTTLSSRYLRINAHLGINCADPTSKLTIEGGSIFLKQSTHYQTSRPAGPSNGDVTSDYVIASYGAGSYPNDMGFLRLIAGNNSNHTRIDLSAYTPSTSHDLHKNITFYTSGTERMRIDHLGNVITTGYVNIGSYFNSPNDNNTHHFGRGAIFGNNDYMYFAHRDMVSTTNYAIRQQNTGIVALNAKAGQYLEFKIGNSTPMMKMTTTGLSVGLGDYVCAGYLDIGSNGGGGGTNNSIGEKQHDSTWKATDYHMWVRSSGQCGTSTYANCRIGFGNGADNNVPNNPTFAPAGYIGIHMGGHGNNQYNGAASGGDLVFGAGGYTDIQSGLPERMRIVGHNGNVGIGITSPIVPLHVKAGGSFTGPANNVSTGFLHDGMWISSVEHKRGATWEAYFAGNSTGGSPPYYSGWAGDYDVGNYTASGATSAYFEAGIMVGGRIYLESDKRVKHAIQVMEDGVALKTIREIECYSYFYNDFIKRSKGVSFGFIAQEVREKIPSAVSIKSGFLPAAMTFAQDISWEEIIDGSNNKYKLTIPNLHKDSSDNVVEYDPGTKFKFYQTDVSNNINNNDFCVSTLLEDGKSFILEKKSNYVFIYGHFVEDFHVLDKEKIFTLHHSAIQELDKENTELKEKVASLESELAAIKTHLGL